MPAVRVRGAVTVSLLFSLKPKAKGGQWVGGWSWQGQFEDERPPPAARRCALPERSAYECELV